MPLTSVGVKAVDAPTPGLLRAGLPPEQIAVEAPTYSLDLMPAITPFGRRRPVSQAEEDFVGLAPQTPTKWPERRFLTTCAAAPSDTTLSLGAVGHDGRLEAHLNSRHLPLLEAFVSVVWGQY